MTDALNVVPAPQSPAPNTMAEIMSNSVINDLDTAPSAGDMCADLAADKVWKSGTQVLGDPPSKAVLGTP